MGCAQSRVRLKKADLSTANGNMTAAQCITGEPLKQRTTYVLKETHALRDLVTENFEIKDHDGAVAFHWAGKMFSVHGKMVLQDINGKKLCLIEHNLLTMPIVGATTFWVYTYQPAFAEQKSDDKDPSGTPMYRYAVITMPAVSCPELNRYSLCTSTNYNRPTPMWIGQGDSFGTGLKMLVCRADTGSEVATIGQHRQESGGLQHAYGVDVSAGTDPVGVLCLALAAEQLQASQERSTKTG